MKRQRERQTTWAIKKLADPVWAAMAERFLNGETCQALAAEHGLEINLVRSVMAHALLRLSKTTPRIAEAMRLYEGGCSYNEIGRLFGCSKQNAQQMLFLRVKARPRGKTHGGWANMIARGEW